MEINSSEQNKSHTGRAVAGFFLSFITFVLLIAGGCLLSVKTTVLKGDSINDILDNCGFYETVQSAVVNELYKNTASIGLSKDAVNKILPPDTIAGAAKLLTDAVTDNTSVDLSYLKDDCLDIAEKTSEDVVDIVFDGIDKSDKAFDVKSLSDNDVVTRFENDYGISVSDRVEASFKSTFGTTKVDLNTVDMDAVKAQVTETLAENVYPAINTAFDRYIDQANRLLNEAIRSVNEDYELNSLIRMAEHSLSMLTAAIVIIYVFAAVLSALQLFIYRRAVYKAFKNFSVSLLISGIIIFVSGMALKFVQDIALEHIDSFDSTGVIIKSFIEDNISAVCNMIIAVGVIYTAVFALSAAAAHIIKNRRVCH